MDIVIISIIVIITLNNIDEFNKYAWRSIRTMQLQIGSHFVGQKKNVINRVARISQHSNEVFENETQLVNIHFKRILVLFLRIRNRCRPKSNYVLTITSRVKKSPHCSF